MRLEDQLREAFRRPEGHPWPDERGAFDRFLRRRARRGRAVAAGACLGLVAVLGAAALLPRLVDGREVVPAIRTVRTVPVPSAGFEVPVPAGWTTRTGGAGTRVAVGLAGPEVPMVQLVPQRRGTGATVEVRTAVMRPRQYPGTRPGTDPDPTGTVGPRAYELDDTRSPLGHGRRPDGRPYVWRTWYPAGEAGEYAVAWPYHCVRTAACPPAAPWRVLVVRGESPDPALRPRVAAVVRLVVDTARPITNALPGGDPGHVDPNLPPVTGRWLLGTGGSGRVAWEAYVRQDCVEAGFELHFPYLKVKPGRGVHDEDVDAYGMLANGELPMLQDCLSWLPGGGVILSGVVPENVVAVRVELEGQDPRRFPTFGTDEPPAWAAYVTAPLPADSRLVRVVALDAQDREVATALPGPFGPRLCRY
jgi:hypothetical protein